MGTLTLPSTGPIYLDASGFIYSVERIEPYCTLLEPMWRQAQVGRKRHPGVRRDPDLEETAWIPACAGMTMTLQAPSVDTPEYITRSSQVAEERGEMTAERMLPEDPLAFIQRCVQHRQMYWTYHMNMRCTVQNLGMGNRSENEEAAVMRCHVCGATMEAIVTTLPLKVRDRTIVIIKGVPVRQCVRLANTC